MTIHPYLARAWEAKAFLDGRKSLFTTLIRPQPPEGYERHCWFSMPLYGFSNEPSPTRNWHTAKIFALGDLLYVKEPWRSTKQIDAFGNLATVNKKAADLGSPCPWYPIQWEADGERNAGAEWENRTSGHLRSGVTLPRWGSRLTLKVEAIRVHRLQDITEAEAAAQGLNRPHKICDDDGTSFTDAFAEEWTNRHSPDDWELNPWVYTATVTVIPHAIDNLTIAA